MKLKIPFLIFTSLSFIYILFGYGVMTTNDSLTNVEQIASLDIWSRSSHFGFHFFGAIFYLIFSKILGIADVTSIEIMLAVISAASAVALYKIVIIKYNSVNQAIITTIIYAFASEIFRFSCQVEYLVLVPAFGIISLYFYSKNKNIIAGIFFGFGLLTSPFEVLFLPTYLLFTSYKELFKKHNIIFLMSVVVIYFSINVFTFDSTVSGEWSYGGEITYYSAVWDDINFVRIGAIYVYGYLRSFNILIVLLPVIIYYLFRNNKELFYILILTLLIHLPSALPEGRYGGYQMTVYPILSITFGLFLNNLMIKNKYLVPLLLIIYTLINFYVVFSERAFHIELKETYVKLSQNLEDNSILLAYQAMRPIKSYYAPNLDVYSLRSNYQIEVEKNIPGFVSTDLKDILNKNETVYLLESGMSMPDDNLKIIFSKFTSEQGAKVKGFALDKILNTNSLFQPEKLNGYPLDVYKLTKKKH